MRPPCGGLTFFAHPPYREWPGFQRGRPGPHTPGRDDLRSLSDLDIFPNNRCYLAETTSRPNDSKCIPSPSGCQFSFPVVKTPCFHPVFPAETPVSEQNLLPRQKMPCSSGLAGFQRRSHRFGRLASGCPALTLNPMKSNHSD